MTTIKVNGKEQALEGPVSVIELIKRNQLEKAKMVSVQINGEFVDRAHFGIINTNHGDNIDFMYFINGGSYPHQVKYR